MIIAIDGPAGAGKSTVAKAVARALGFGYLDTGAMYRAITYKALETKTGLENETALGELAEAALLELNDSHIFIDGRDVTEEIRLPRVGRAVSLVSSAATVRRRMVAKQREVAAALKNAIVEGRDIGTVVFPDAEVKIFLTAVASERTARRLAELRTKELDVEAAAVERELLERDRLDSGRDDSPLLRAPDAHLIDTTDKTVDDVVQAIKVLAEAAGGRNR